LSPTVRPRSKCLSRWYAATAAATLRSSGPGSPKSPKASTRTDRLGSRGANTAGAPWRKAGSAAPRASVTHLWCCGVSVSSAFSSFCVWASASRSPKSRPSSWACCNRSLSRARSRSSAPWAVCRLAAQSLAYRVAPATARPGAMSPPRPTTSPCSASTPGPAHAIVYQYSNTRCCYCISIMV